MKFPWQHIKLSELAQVFNGKTPSKKEQKQSGFPVLKIKNISGCGEFVGMFNSFVNEEFEVLSNVVDEGLKNASVRACLTRPLPLLHR